MNRSLVKLAIGCPLLFVVSAPPLRAQERVDVATIERILDEAENRSQVMEIASWLTDVYGPRLSWSPGLARARAWTMAKMAEWGLANVHEEVWSTPAGSGWENRRFTFSATSPVSFVVHGEPVAWSSGTDGPVTGPAVQITTAGCMDELKSQYGGRLRSAFVMPMPPAHRPVTQFDPPAERLTDSTLAEMAAATISAPGSAGGGAGGQRTGSPSPPPLSPACEAQFLRDSTEAARLAAARGLPLPPLGPRGGIRSDSTTSRWFLNEGIAAIVISDPGHTGGAIGAASSPPTGPRLPVVRVAQESYGRIARILEKGIPVTLELDMRNEFYPEMSSESNLIAEIPGTDPVLRDEVVMIGAHFDSWHVGTGATDNAAGTAVVLEAMRLLKALDLRPRRTIRIALWTGEEQGLFGSTAYVRQHFGMRDTLGFHPTDEQPRLAGYFNLDNGGGKIRGVYLQRIEAARPIFEAWMRPFGDMGMGTATIESTGGTDHLSFIGVGLPGFQFIQDPLDYDNLTHHTNQDVYERLQPEDLVFNAAVLASFAWQAAQRDEKLPRPPQPGPLRRPSAR